MGITPEELDVIAFALDEEFFDGDYMANKHKENHDNPYWKTARNVRAKIALQETMLADLNRIKQEIKTA
jgi:hypothetical protein